MTIDMGEGRQRVVIEGLKPQVDCGRFPIKRTVGEEVTVEADVFADGHDEVGAAVVYRRAGAEEWAEAAMEALGNDRWRGTFRVGEVGEYEYAVTGWIDRYRSWCRDLEKRVVADQDVSVNVLEGAELVDQASKRASVDDAKALRDVVERLRSNDIADTDKAKMACSYAVVGLMSLYTDRAWAGARTKSFHVMVDRQKAGFSSWYEMFPRSAASEPGRHGTFRDCEVRLPYIASMGFDVLYFPPIHPIAHSRRKGKNNAPIAQAGDPGSPWAIGAEEGGHKSIHPELGSLDEFRHLVRKAQEYGIEIALDLAFQCSAEHPYVREHPEWFRWRPDGTIQYAENPPKKYEDIFPLDFETEDWKALWQELLSVVLFWVGQGVRIFRVDNPHTKPFSFWEWLIREVHAQDPGVVFLAEAFTRPKVMYRLAKLGFSQSYTYFTWRNTKWELTQYLNELTHTELREFFRPNFWANTPDILHEYLQKGGRPAFIARLVLAATLGCNYGIYGPPFELCENKPREQGSEEYLNSEKYEIRYWHIEREDSLKELIGRVNRIRRETPALREQASLRFLNVDNDQLICYSKHTESFGSVVMMVVNLDPINTQSGWVEVPIGGFGLDILTTYEVEDLLTGSRYQWQGAWNYIELDPAVLPAHILRILW